MFLDQTEIIAAVWGLTEVTKEMKEKYETGNQREFEASVEKWGEGWPGHLKTLNVVYKNNDNIASVVVVEGDLLELP